MKLSLKAAAITAGLMSAGYILSIGLIHLADPAYGAGFWAVVNSVYAGLHFAHEWENVALGTVYGFLDGAIGGLIFAWIYDRLVSRGHLRHGAV